MKHFPASKGLGVTGYCPGEGAWGVRVSPGALMASSWGLRTAWELHPLSVSPRGSHSAVGARLWGLFSVPLVWLYCYLRTSWALFLLAKWVYQIGSATPKAPETWELPQILG